MAWKPRMRWCGYASKNKKRHRFKAFFKEAKYCSKKCRDAAAQQRVRERSKAYTDQQLENFGAVREAAGGTD